MKTIYRIFALTLALALAFAFVPTRAQDDDSSASFQTFYDQLGSQGTWVNTDNYGYVWQPSSVDNNWQPYTNGHWVYTDDGWTWVTDEPWGWATYHYGRWVNLDGQGWVWVPGYTWAPAWVSWRYGGGYCGWAPLPPETFVGIDFGGIGFGFHIGGDCDEAYGIGAGYYSFLPVGYLGARDYRPFYRHRFENFAIINRTRNVTNININERGRGRFGRVNVGGPAFATVNAQSRTPIQRATLAAARDARSSRLEGNSLAVYAPHVNAANNATAKPARVDGNLTHVNANRGTDINKPLLTNSRATAERPTADQVQAARDAQTHAPRDAKVATVNTPISHPLTQPLTSLQPHERAAVNANAAATATGANPAADVRTGGASHREEAAATGGDLTPRAAGEVHSATHREDAAATGGDLAPRNTTANTPAEATPHVSHHDQVAAATGGERHAKTEATTAVNHHTAAATQHEAATPSVVHHSSAPVEHHAAAPVTHSAPAQHSAPAFHAASHAASAPHPSAAPHAAAPAPHPSGGGGGGHAGGGGGGGKKK